MKNKTKYLLQSILGFERYLRIFGQFKIATLKKDKKERDFFAFISTIKYASNILDIGANIGVMTVHLAQKFPQAKIHAIEPLKPNMDILKYTVKKRKLSNVITYQTALGDQKGMIEMVMPKDGKTRLHGLSHVVHDSIREWNNGQRFEVSCDTVDNLFGQLDVQGIKIDVENFEYFVLKGAQNLIKRCKPVIYAELWDNDNRKKCFELMKNLNYGIYCVQDQKITPWNKNIQTQNFIFKPE